MSTNTNDGSLDTTRKRRWPRRLAIIFGAVLALCLIAFGAFAIYTSDYYHDFDTSHTDLISTEGMPVAEGSNYLAFGDPNATTALVFYPGAKIESSAYAPLLREIAAEGYLCIVVEMPFNFAFFDMNAALRVVNDYPSVEHWWIGGHSLGGAMAASFIADHTEEFEGLVLLGAYSASDLSNTDLTILSMYGSNDLVLDHDKVVESREFMPESYTEEIIEGGNHAYFGNYGPQEGDGEASITPEEQWDMTAEAIADTMK